jgi:5-methylcytosine-specific restriction endonuclease McrA
MKCVICGDDYPLKNKHGGRKKVRPVCSKYHCNNLWTYRARLEHYRKRGLLQYWHEKKHLYSHLRAKNQKAKARQRFGFSSREEFIRSRGGCCENCGGTNWLIIHHIDNRGRKVQNRGEKPNNDPNNLMVLCNGCHTRYHRWGHPLKMKRKSDTPSNRS